MKLLLILIALFAINIYSQETVTANSTLSWTDSLWTGVWIDTVGVDDTTAAQATSELRLNGQYDWMTITAVDTGTTYDDSCSIEAGIYVVANYAITDTVWQKVQFMRDSSWTNTNGSFLVDDNSVKSYTVFVGNYDLIRVKMNNVELIDNRVFWFYALLSRKK